MTDKPYSAEALRALESRASEHTDFLQKRSDSRYAAEREIRDERGDVVARVIVLAGGFAAPEVQAAINDKRLTIERNDATGALSISGMNNVSVYALDLGSGAYHKQSALFRAGELAAGQPVEAKATRLKTFIAKPGPLPTELPLFQETYHDRAMLAKTLPDISGDQEKVFSAYQAERRQLVDKSGAVLAEAVYAARSGRHPASGEAVGDAYIIAVNDAGLSVHLDNGRLSFSGRDGVRVIDPETGKSADLFELRASANELHNKAVDVQLFSPRSAPVAIDVKQTRYAAFRDVLHAHGSADMVLESHHTLRPYLADAAGDYTLTLRNMERVRLRASPPNQHAHDMAHTLIASGPMKLGLSDTDMNYIDGAVRSSGSSGNVRSLALGYQSGEAPPHLFKVVEEGRSVKAVRAYGDIEKGLEAQRLVAQNDVRKAQVKQSGASVLLAREHEQAMQLLRDTVKAGLEGAAFTPPPQHHEAAILPFTRKNPSAIR